MTAALARAQAHSAARERVAVPVTLLVVRRRHGRSDTPPAPAWLAEPLLHEVQRSDRIWDIDTAQRLLDWPPQVAPDEGLLRKIAYFRQLGSLPAESTP